MSGEPTSRTRRFIPAGGAASQRLVGPAHSLDLIRSRSLLVDVLSALEAHRAALTVIGAHAVLERTNELEPYLVSDSTREADLGVTPELLGGTPLLASTLHELGLEESGPARPGVWGLVAEHDRDVHDRLTIDLIAPASLAGPGRRAARIGEHGRRAVSRTNGTELSVIDRSLMRVLKLDSDEGVDAFVAGPAALLCAKGYKLFDRLDEHERRRNPARLRTKDAGDIYRVMATSDPVVVREVFRQGEDEPRIAAAVRMGYERLLLIREPLIDLAVRHYRGVFEERTVVGAMSDWLDDFTAG